jgi:hypothetical protein
VDANPAFMTNQCTTYLALNCQKVQGQTLDPFEEIEVELVPMGAVSELIHKRVISHSLVVAAFYFFEIRGRI